MQVDNAQLALQELKLCLPECFGEDIGGLFLLGPNMRECKNASFEFFREQSDSRSQSASCAHETQDYAQYVVLLDCRIKAS